MKSKMKKTLAALLSFLMVFALLPISIFEAAAIVEDGQSEETAVSVATVYDLALALTSNEITYIRIAEDIEYTHTASTNGNGFFDVVGTKVLVGDNSVTLKMSGSGAQVKSMFYLDEASDNLTLHNVGTYTFESNNATDGTVVFVQDGTFTLEGSTLRGQVVEGLNAGCHAVYVSGGTANLRSGTLFGTAQGCTVFWGVLYVCGGSTNLGGTLATLTINGYADPNYRYHNTCAGVAVYGGAHQMVSISGNVEINQVRDHSIRTYTTSKQKISTIIGSGCSVYPNVATLAGKQPIGTNTEAIAESVRVIRPVSNAVFRLDGYQVGVKTDVDGFIDMTEEDMNITAIGGQINVLGVYVSTSSDVDDTAELENTTLVSGQTYWLIVQFGAADGYDASFLNENLISLSGVTSTDQDYEYDSTSGCGYAKFELPQLKDYQVTDFVFGLEGYELGANVEDITVTVEGDTQSRVELWGSNGVFIADTIAPNPDDTASITGNFVVGKDYYLVVTFDAKTGNDISGVNAMNSHLTGVTATVEGAYYTSAYSYGTVIFKLPQIPATPITSLNFTVSGYGMGKTPADFTVTEADGTGKVTIDDIKISTTNSEENAISPSMQFPQNQDLWLFFTIAAAEGLSVAGITDSLISFSGVKVTEKPTVTYNATFDYMTISLKLPQINTSDAVPNVWVDISGYEYGEAIADLEATIDAECDDYVELYMTGIYSQEDCDPADEITTGNFQAETDYWLEVIVVSKGSYHLEYATDAISRLDGVTYTEMNAAYDKFADFFCIRVKLNQLEVPGVAAYTVTFDTKGGSEVAPQTIEEGGKVTKPADPTKDGYDFKGWTLNGSAYDFNTAVNGNITLVATWKQKQVVPTTYTVSFAANGGTGTMADVTGISGEYTLPENGFAAPDGKQFKAWSVGGVEKAVGDKITVTANTTITAVWETIPAGHTCDIKPVAKVEPSCTEGGKEAYYKCEGCGKFYEDALGTKEITDLASWGNLAKLGHTESDWKSDKDNHWKECTVAACGVIIENSKAAHADANNDGKCDVCEYNVGIPTTPGGDEPGTDTPGTDEPGTDTPGTDDPNTGNTDEPKDDEGGLGTGAIVAIVVGSVLVVGVGGFALFWFVIKKKSFADLIAVFKKK